MSTCVVVICGHGINDPLVSTLMLDYVLRLQAQDGVQKVLLITEEPGVLEIPFGLLERLAEAQVEWFPLRYTIGSHRFLQRGRNLVRMILHALAFARGAERKVVVGFLSMAGSYASVLRSVGFDLSILVNFEPHSRYMVEMGVWREGSIRTRVARYFERRQLRNADVVIAPSNAVVHLLHESGVKAEIFLQGVTVDVASHARRPLEGERIRTALGLAVKTVLAYAGKFNGIYHSEGDYVRFMATTCALDVRIHHLIITFPEHAATIESLAITAGLQHRFTLHAPMPPDELTNFLSAADMGVIAVPPTPSQQFRSPVKTALYWAAGLPILIAKGVADDWWIAQERRIGIVVKDLVDLDPEAFRQAMDTYTPADRSALRARCVQAAVDLRDSGRMVRLLRQAILGKGDEQTAHGAKGPARMQP